MPILAREVDCYPSNLFEGDWEAGLLPAGRNWWLTYSRSRREKDLSRRLAAAGVSFYCPTISRRTRSASGRVRESWVPLFPGYLFLYGTPDDRVAALSTNCVSATVAVADAGEERLVGELRAIRRLIESQVPITPEERLESGQPVRVVSGPLRGQEGIVIERRGRRRLLVALQLLQRGASADLDECDVERV